MIKLTMKEGTMENEFSQLGVIEEIVKAISEMGFNTPTIVQSRVIPHILANEDVIVMSKTGSGKTGAFGIPVLQNIDCEKPGPQALILTPTRELAVQVDSDIKNMSKYKKLTTTAVYGQHNIQTEITALKKGAAIVTGTPGRVFDHIQRRTLNTKNIKFLILDEADRMLDMGFIDQVFKIVKTIPRQRVTMMFSATMPREIKVLSKSYMKQPVVIELESDTKTVDTTEQEYYRVAANEKRTQLDRLLKYEQPDGCLIFCNTRFEVDKVKAYLAKKRYFVGSIHGANSQSSRIKTLDRIKKGELQIVVATDVAARGLHIEDLSHVINYDVPNEKDAYVHRIGRTGRAGKSGIAITLVTSEDIMSLYEIEEHVGALMHEGELPTDEQVNKSVEQATGKWANKKAPIYSEHVSKRSTTGSHKTKQYHTKHTPKISHQSKSSKTHHTEKPRKTTNVAVANKQYKPKVNKETPKNVEYKPRANKNYRPQKAYQLKNIQKPTNVKKTLFNKVTGILKKK